MDRSYAFVVGLLAAATLFGACGDDYGQSTTPPPVADGGVDAPPAPACTIVYVSPSGDDNADGCTQTTPKKTLGAAIVFVSRSKLVGAEIHACAGVYREPGLGLAYPVSLRGGYDCATWMRGDGFGKKGGFKEQNVTRIETPEANAAATLTVESSAVTHDVILEGLQIAGRDGETGAAALLIDTNASLVVTDVQIIGGKSRGGSKTIGSIGLWIKDSTAEIKDSQIDGGSGTGTIGSAAVHVEGSKVDLHDDEIVAGKGAGNQVGAIGILFAAKLAERSTIARNTIRWGNPTADGSSLAAAYGLYAESGTLDFTDNAILGETALCHTSPCTVAGIAASGPLELNAIGNRIHAGDVMGVAGSFVKGIVLANERRTVVANNIVLLKSAMTTMGIEVDAVDPVVVNNTVLGSTGVQPSIAINVLGTANGAKGTGAVIDGNVLALNATGVTTGVFAVGFRYESCNGAKWASAKNNLVVNMDATLVELSGSGCSAVNYAPTPSDMTARLGSGIAFGNVAIHAGCTDPMACLPVTCTDANGCISKLFPAHDFPSGGAVSLLADGAYRPAATLPCAIARGFAMPPMATPAKDVYGAMRTPPFSIGAAEQESCAGE